MKKNAGAPSAPAVKPAPERTSKGKVAAIEVSVDPLPTPAVPMKPIPAAAAEVAVKTKKLPSKTVTKSGSAKTAPKAAEPAKPDESKEKPKKPKLVRDSFTMPEAEYAVLGEVKKDCLKAGIEVKKSELLRVGVALLRDLDTVKLKELVDKLTPLKTGRPKKTK